MNTTRQSSVTEISLSTHVVLVILPFLFLVVAVLYNVISFASLGTVGGELYAITSKTDQITAQNQKMIEELAQKQSLHDTVAQAETEGFVPISVLTKVDLKDTKVALRNVSDR